MLHEEGLPNVFARHPRHAEATRAAVRGLGPGGALRSTSASTPARSPRSCCRTGTTPTRSARVDPRALRHVARRRPRQAGRQGLPDRAPRPLQRPDARRHARRRADGPAAGRRARRAERPRRPRSSRPRSRRRDAAARGPRRSADGAPTWSARCAASSTARSPSTTTRRHLFSRDASMYAIEPLGVVFPGTPTTSPPPSRLAAELGVPVAAARRRHQPGRPDRRARPRAGPVPAHATGSRARPRRPARRWSSRRRPGRPQPRPPRRTG